MRLFADAYFSMPLYATLPLLSLLLISLSLFCHAVYDADAILFIYCHAIFAR